MDTFIISVDQREKLPFTFSRWKPHIQTCHLRTGDYSVAGLESRVIIERKSKQDLYSTVGQHRKRFERELIRLDEIVSAAGPHSSCCAAVVVESPIDDVMFNPPERSKLNPKSLWASVVAWQVRYRVSWLFCPSRDFAEVFTYRLLERAWKDHEKKVPIRPCGV